mgnify:CR=1 FL=1
MDLAADRFIGCMPGRATGDALASPNERGLPERLVWRFVG